MAAPASWAEAGPVALLVLVNLIFSAYAVLGALAFTSGTSPMVFALLRNLIAVSLFVPALLLEEARGAGAGASPPRPWRLLPRAEHFAYFFGLAVTGVWGSQLLSALTISNLSASIYGLLKPAVPVVTLALSAALGLTAFDLRTRPTQLTVAGVLLAISGAVAVVAASFGTGESKNAGLGAGFVSVYMVCAGSYPLLQKHMLSRLEYSPLFLVAWAYVIGTALIGASVFVAVPPAASWIVSGRSAGGLFFSGMLTSFFNYLAMAYINRRLTPVIVSSFYPLQSFFTPMLAAAATGFTPSASDFGGGAIIICGLALCVRAQMIGVANSAAVPTLREVREPVQYVAPLLSAEGDAYADVAGAGVDGGAGAGAVDVRL